MPLAKNQLDLRLYNFRNRTYGVNLGRFLQRDPIGVWGDRTNMGNGYAYVGNSPVSRRDAFGLWGDGSNGTSMNPRDWGHSDFPGHDQFDYTREDHDATTKPYPGGAPDNHFRELIDVELDLAWDVYSCDRWAFERHAHQMQDWFSHFGQGYDWNPLGFEFGHALQTAFGKHVGRTLGTSSPRPDDPRDFWDAYLAAEARTREWVEFFNSCCCAVPVFGVVNYLQ